MRLVLRQPGAPEQEVEMHWLGSIPSTLYPNERLLGVICEDGTRLPAYLSELYVVPDEEPYIPTYSRQEARL